MNIVRDVGNLNEMESITNEPARTALALIDKLEASRYLVQAAVMAHDNIEDIAQRNALNAIMSEIEAKLQDVVTGLRADFVC